MERGNHAYMSVVKGLSDREANDALNVFVSMNYNGSQKSVLIQLLIYLHMPFE